MRLLLIHSGSDLYGASRSFLRLTSRLVADKHAILAILPSSGPLLRELNRTGVKVRVEPNMPLVTRQGFGKRWGMLRVAFGVPGSVWRMIRLIREFKPDVVHTNTAIAMSPALASWLTRVPHLWHMREFFGDFPGLWKPYQWFMFTFADRIACVSGAVAQQFADKYRRKTVVLHNGFPNAEFEDVSQREIADFRERFALHSHRTVGLVGRIKLLRKGQEVFVRAAAKIKNQFPDTRFLCIGSPFPGNEDHLQCLLDLVRKLQLGQQFVYTGDIEHMQPAYAALDVSVLASVQPEPFAGVVIESMAMGVPVVGTAAGGTVDQIEDGVTGLLVPPGDADSMAAALAELLASPQLRAQFGRAARDRFLTHFEFEPFYSQLTKLYQSLVYRRASSTSAA